jgi:hypothetical protein
VTRNAGAQRAAVAARVLTASCAILATTGNTSFARDASRVQSFTVGASPGLASCEGLDATNANRARVHFPRSAEVAFRLRIAGGVGQAPASDAAGNLIVAHGEPRVSKLDPRGQTLWTERLTSEVASSPVITSDGSILLLTRDAEALILAPSGKPLHKSVLPFAEPLRHVLAIPTSNSGALVASGADIAELDAQGEVIRQTHLPGAITALAEWHSDLLAICENGTLVAAQITGDFEVIGNLGGTAPEGGAAQAGKLFAIVDAHKLVAFDLSTHSVVTLASDPASVLNGPVTLLENQSAVVVADGGFLSIHAASGAEALRVSVAEVGRAFDPALRALRPASTISDRAGAVAAARSGSDALILQADGKAQRFDNTSCLDPFRPTPTRAGVVFACRAGQLFGVSDKAP